MKKLSVVGIILLFVGVSFTSCVGVNIEQTSFPLNAWETAWWKFDEGSGTIAYDSSGHGYDGTVVGATWTTDGLSLDGMDDYVVFDNHSIALGMNKTDYYIIMVRFKSTGSGMFYSMSHTNPERAYFDLMLDEEGRITVEMGDETCLFDLSTSGSFNDGEWHLVECYFEGDSTNPTLEIYVDDETEATTTEWLSPMIDEDFLTAKVGRDSNAESDYFDGVIDDIKIYKPIDCSCEPPCAPTINGPTGGDVGDTLIYTFCAIEPDGDDVRFHIDWGDGNTEWTIYVPGGTDLIVSHTWDHVDTFSIEAYAEDETGLIGPSTTFQVIIPRNKPLNFNYLKWRLNNILLVLQLRSKSTEEVKHETTVRIHNSRGITPFTLKLTERESNEIDVIFDNLKVSLDSAETDKEIDEIYDDAVGSLYELGMFPRMTLKEAKQLVNGKSVKSRPGNLDNGNENFNCQISGTLSNSNCYHGTLGSLFRGRFLFLFINILVYLFYGRINLPYFKGRILEIIFGTNFIIYDSVDYYPAAGWVHSNGSNGVIKWDGRFYGNIDYWEREEENPPGYKFKEGRYIGVTEFNGVFIDSLYDYKVNFLGNAEHVSLTYTPSWP